MEIIINIIIIIKHVLRVVNACHSGKKKISCFTDKFAYVICKKKLNIRWSYPVRYPDVTARPWELASH